jgi:dTDP-4-amino-4,6-dideoxygalactose transaminase
MLSINELNKLNSNFLNKFDGIIVTNVFSLLPDFSAYEKWCIKNNKILVIDNATGISANLTNVSYQALSLHHTKPYGFGEGGLAIVDKCDYEIFLSLIEYSPMKNQKNWVTNGKLSDWSCAPIINRLKNADSWIPLYQEQANRIESIAIELGIDLLGITKTTTMSLPLLFKNKVNLKNNKFIQLGKYYQPLKQTKNTMKIYNRIINFPCHPDVKNLSKDIIIKILKTFL